MFLIDAQLPRKLKRVFQNAGFECIHTLELEDRNATTDADIASIADQQERIVVTKDGDFRISHQLRGKPKRLLMIATGNCSNRFLTDLLERTLDECVRALELPGMVELRVGVLIVTPSEILD